MANYKVGDLEVTINGVSKDAVSSLDDVIERLDKMQSLLPAVTKGFNTTELKKSLTLYREQSTIFRALSFSAQNAVSAQIELSDAFRNVENSAQGVISAFSAYDSTSQEVNRLASAWKNMFASIPRFGDEDFSTEYVEQLNQALNNLGTEYLRNKQIVDETNEAFKRMAMTEQELALYDFQQEQAARKQRIAYLNLMIVTGQAGDKTREYTQELKQLIKQQQIADKVAGKSATGGFSKLIKQIGRIALYRTIRRGLQMITQTFRESIQAYAQVDDNINKMMSQLTSSTKVISLSLGTIIFPILQAITPIVQQLSIGFANMANAINKSMALAQGNATYTKINTNALKDYRKELNKTTGALFDFDKFRALSSKQDTASIFLSTEETTALDEAESKYSSIYTLVSGIGGLLKSVLETIDQIGRSATFQTILTVVGYSLDGLARAASWLLEILNTSHLLEPVLGGIAGYLTYIGVSKLFIALSGGKLWAWIKAVVDLLKYDARGTIKMLTGDFAKFMSSTKMLAVSFGALSGSIIYLIQNWKDMSETGRALTLTLSLVAAAVVGVFTALVAAKWAGLGIGAAIKAGLSAAALTAAIGIAIGTAASTAKSATADIPKYAMGASNIDSGSLFIAGEAGKTEAIFTGDNGKTNVANVQQMYQAEYMAVLQALKDYGAARGEMPQLQPASDTGIYQAASRGAGKAGKRFTNY